MATSGARVGGGQLRNCVQYGLRCAQEVLAGSGPSRLAPPLPLPELMQHLRARLAPLDMEPDEGEEPEQRREDEKKATQETEAEQAAGQEPGHVAAGPGQGQQAGPQAPNSASPGSATAATTATNAATTTVAADTNGLVSISLRCPLSGGVVACPGHLGATAAARPLAFFDLHVFLEQARATGSWACPATGTLGSIHDLRVGAVAAGVGCVALLPTHTCDLTNPFAMNCSHTFVFPCPRGESSSMSL